MPLGNAIAGAVTLENAEPADVTDETFEAIVLRSDRPVLVDFWAPWCGPCLVVGPVVQELAGELEGRVRVARVNVDENAAISTAHAIFSMPTLVLFRDGREVDRIVGLRRKEELASLLEPHLAN